MKLEGAARQTLQRRPDDAAAIRLVDVHKDFVLTHNGVRDLKARVVGLFDPRWRPHRENLRAVDGVTLTVARGEALAVLGPNGSGKSTLLQLIAGILTPTSGTVETTGRVAPLIELGVGFHPDLTGAENIFLNASLFGVANRTTRARFDSIVRFAGLEAFIDAPVKNYSSGMYMRLGFAIAVHMEPDVLLADEILAVGDEAFQAQCHQRIAALRAGGMTLVLVTHSREQARRFCDRWVQVERGRIVDSGRFTPLEGPRHRPAAASSMQPSMTAGETNE